MKKQTVAIISILCTLVVCLSVYFVSNYFDKRDGRTRESRELILREELDADFVICEQKINGIIYVAFEFPNGRIGVAGFEEEGDRYKISGLHTKYSDSDVPNVNKVIWEYADIIFLNKPDLSYVELTYEVIDIYGKNVQVTNRLEFNGDRILYAERPQYSEPISMVFYDINGKEYAFIDESEYPNGCYVKK